ncbi:cytochrome c maturation protein CcmE [Seleniivibrio woodruffii]|uniref:Cytochrome c-type biogenesis protein CcmE n=1 Tax=Seleniivibrio woodruffii TaxID=1078050 RepID=A0A4R1K8E8_9BACT|nr:cytochrome c maturation protein CcmE [Seleniivibrio woodruffii]TCK59389.1 cytochrome c-type biogenesis protein CcmE [Seleniivibrio woodruffii]TVZ35570.1 cytochrome c-type biogenesis protein CcmE [Seleniivibrio woodruffii]
MKKSYKFILAGVVFACVIGWLLMSSFSQDSVYYLEVHEITKNPDKYNQKGMRVTGNVVKGTITQDYKKQYLLFTIQDIQGEPDTIQVEYNGIIPDTFKEDIHVIVEGKYDKEKKLFNAETVLTKCPSKYEAELEQKAS